MNHMPVTLIGISAGIESEESIANLIEPILKKNTSIVLIDSTEGPAVRLFNRQGVRYKYIDSKQRFSTSQVRKLIEEASYAVFVWDGKTLSELVFEAKRQNLPSRLHAVETTTVVNKDKGDDFDIYIGRGTPWGNPYPVGVGDGKFSREEAIRRYKDHFEKNILGDPEKRKGLLSLRGYRLGCHCKPFACHGDIIAGYLNNLNSAESLSTTPELATEQDPKT